MEPLGDRLCRNRHPTNRNLQAFFGRLRHRVLNNTFSTLNPIIPKPQFLNTNSYTLISKR